MLDGWFQKISDYLLLFYHPGNMAAAPLSTESLGITYKPAIQVCIGILENNIQNKSNSISSLY